MAAPSPTQTSRLYGFVRGRQLEGTYPGGRTRGIWVTTGMRILRGWGSVSEEDWPYSAGLDQWPPIEPPGLDEKAKRNRILRYQRIHHSLECKYALANWGPVQASFEVTGQWLDAKYGIIEMPDEKTPFIGSHAVCLTGCSDAEEMFRFVNSWGEDWGEAGFGKLPYEYFDRWMLDVYVVDSRPFELPLTTAVPIADLKWGGHDFAERPFHVHELRDTTSDERIAWAFAMPSDDFLDVEEIFVRPQFRHRGYGTHLLRSLHSISRTAGLHLRVFIPFADCEDNNLKAVERLLAKEGYFLIASDVRWVPYTAMRKPEFVRIPPPPALVRRCDGDMLAAAVLQVDQSTAGNKTILPEAAEVVCANELHYRRLTPTGNSTHNTSDDSWLVILGDWSSRPREELISRIAAIFQQRDELAAVPIVLVVDDLGKSDADHQALLIALTEAGANILAPHSQEEADTIMKDPVAFAASELAVVMRSHSVSATTRSPSDPNSPDAFKEFAKAVTRLSPADLKEIINGQRTDDWRYSG